VNSRVCRLCGIFILIMDSRGTFENSAVPQLVKKFPDFYETEISFPCSQRPTTWHSSLSTALKYRELIQRVKKDQPKRKNTEPAATQSLSTAGGFPRNHTCRHPRACPVIPRYSRFLLLQHQTIAQCPTRNLSCDRHGTPRASRRYILSFYALFTVHPSIILVNTTYLITTTTSLT